MSAGIEGKLNYVENCKLYFSIEESGTISHFMIETFHHWLGVSKKDRFLFVTCAMYSSLQFGDNDTIGTENFIAFLFLFQHSYKRINNTQSFLKLSKNKSKKKA